MIMERTKIASLSNTSTVADGDGMIEREEEEENVLAEAAEWKDVLSYFVGPPTADLDELIATATIPSASFDLPL